MDSRGFQFKQFFVAHDLCAMKVGTDSILLGSWVASCLLAPGAPATTQDTLPASVLDIGSGSGVLTLMLAQALHAKQNVALMPCLVAVEPELHAFEQSCQNFRASPWHNEICAVNSTIQKFFPEHLADRRQLPSQYDVLISNPPYFPAIRHNQTVLPCNRASSNNNKGTGNTVFTAQRKLARHQSELDLTTLIQQVVRLLSPNGQFFCILPAGQAAQLKLIAQNENLKVNAELFIAPVPQKSIKRVAMKFSFNSLEYQSEKITIRNESGEYSTRFKALCRAYYLNF